ncbi:DEAD/DEAH box helicase [Streptomyces sp. NPDC048496]|uniref:DEAD/DEAH box helicase n=1 Tax=Streptomyces sp. NPDC048496 TaxID=3365558 RepID=UPI003722C6CE
MKDYNGKVRRLGEDALADGEAAPLLRAQLRSHVLGDQISTEGPAAVYTYSSAGLRRGLTLARLGQLTRTPRERRADPGPLPEIAEAYADLAERHEPGDPRRTELLAIAASMWSLAGYQANSHALATGYLHEVRAHFARGEGQVVESPTTAAPYRIAEVTGALLRRDIYEAARLGEQAREELVVLGHRLVDEAAEGRADQADAAVLAAYGLAGRAARSMAALWRLGDRSAGKAAVADLRKAASILLDASVADTWTLVDSLAHVVEDIVATSPWLLLRRASTWGPEWERYLKALVVAGRPMTQVWPSQRTALDAGLVDRDAGSMIVTMPTSAGKTHIAEWAILHALAHRPADPERNWWAPAPLAVYVVPTRALAAQVEQQLSETLELAGHRVSSLFGGSEHVRYESQLLDFTDVLVVTSEKLDLLLRNLPELAARLALVLVDEAHLLDRSDRGLRLEMLLTRIRLSTPSARLLLLSAVLPNGADLARWLDPRAQGRNHASIDWSPSRLRTGIFSWRGRETDGQSGTIDYRNSQRDEFFLPRVLTRHRKRTRLFPEAPKDVAAALALHFDRLGPVLISSPTPIKASAAAKALVKALTVPGTPGLGSQSASPADLSTLPGRRLRLAAEIARHTGYGHELTDMVLHGCAYHHGEVPQAVRTHLERAYRDGTLRVLCATSTLSQGMNLPVKTVLVPDVWRNQGEAISVRDFWNTAGRAGRAFHETEGHVVLIAKDPTSAARLRRTYLDRGKVEPVVSALASLYLQLTTARLGHPPQAGQDLHDLVLDDPDDPALADWARGLDVQLLTLLAEEAVDTPDQELLERLALVVLQDTLGGHQLGVRQWQLEPLARFSARRITAIARQIPDRPSRAAIVRTGLSVQGGIEALNAAEEITATLIQQPELLDPDHWNDLRGLVLNAATHITELLRGAARKKVPPSAIAPLADDWVNALPITDLHSAHHTALGTADVTATTTVLDQVVAHDLAWAVSAVLQLLELKRGTPAEGHLAALPAMIKYGVATPAACYAASIGVNDRTAATALASHFPDPAPTLGQFLDWISQLTAPELTTLTDPDTAALLIRSAERRSPQAARTVILRGTGTLTTPLRGIRHAASHTHLAHLVPGTVLNLVRDRSNTADPNAIRVEHDGRLLGWIARETASPLAIVLDDQSAPTVHARLHTDPDSLTGHENGAHPLHARDTVQIRVILTRA